MTLTAGEALLLPENDQFKQQKDIFREIAQPPLDKAEGSVGIVSFMRVVCTSITICIIFCQFLQPENCRLQLCNVKTFF